MTDTDPCIDARKLKTRDVLLIIVRKPYDEDIVILTDKGDAAKFVSRLRTTFTRVKETLANRGSKSRPLTMAVVSIEALEGADKLTLRTQKTRSVLGDPLGDLAEEMSMES